MNKSKGNTSTQGWECPRCGVIHAPSVRVCDCQRLRGETSSAPWYFTIQPAQVYQGGANARQDKTR